MRWKVLAPLLASGIVLLCGCSVEILHDLDEAQANEILDVLEQEGVRGKKIRVTQGTSATYTVAIGRGDAPAAWGVLRRRNLPRVQQRGLAEVFGNVGLVPTATQERALMRHAISGELARTLQGVEGVHDARVHVVLPTREPLAPPDAPVPTPRAAVLLKVGASSPLREAQVRQLVAGAVDGLAPDAVSVVILAGKREPPRADSGLASVGPFAVAHSSRAALLATAIAAVLLLAGSTLAVLLLVRRLRTLRRVAALAPAPVAPPATLDVDSSMSLMAQSFRQHLDARSSAARPTRPPEHRR